MTATHQIGGPSPIPPIPHFTSWICGVPAPKTVKPTEAKRSEVGGRNHG